MDDAEMNPECGWMSAGTLVRMADGGSRRLDAVYPGDTIITVDELGGSAAESKVLAAHRLSEQLNFRVFVFGLCVRGSAFAEPLCMLAAGSACRVLRDCNDREDWQNHKYGSAFNAIPVNDWHVGDFAIWHDPECARGQLMFANATRWHHRDEVTLLGVVPAITRLSACEVEIESKSGFLLLANGLIVATRGD